MNFDLPMEDEPPSTPAIPLDKLAKVFTKLRDTKAALTAQYEANLKEIEDKIETVEDAMRQQLRALGASSAKTPYGTVIMSVKTRYSPQDWSAFYSFIKENDALELLERRVAQGNIKKFLEANPENPPPSLNVFSEYDVTVRKNA